MAPTSPSILLVDDSPDELRLLSEMLRTEQYRLLVATDGRQGYQRAVIAQPELILMDVSMPLMDGISAARLLKADAATSAIPLIFLSAMNAPEERLQGLRVGAADYISKPFEAEEVLLRINVHLRRTREQTNLVASTAAPDWATCAAPIARAPNETQYPDQVLAQAAVQIIRDHLDNLPPVAEIANLVGTYDKKLLRIFRQEFNMTISSFIKEERIQVARQLLTATDMPVNKVAEMAGMENAANFATAFRERMGVSPSAYREASRECARA